MIDQLTPISEGLFNLKINQLGKLLIILSACILSLASTVITIYTLLTKITAITDLLQETHSLIRIAKSKNFIILELVVAFTIQLPMVYREDHEPLINTVHYVFSLIIDLIICYVAIALQLNVRSIHEDVIKTYQQLSQAGSNQDAADFRLYADELNPRKTELIETNMNTGAFNKHRQNHRLLQLIMLKTSNCFGSSLLLILFTTRYLFAFHLYNWISSDYPVIELVRSALSFVRMLHLCYRIEKLQTENKAILDTVNEFDPISLEHHSKIEPNRLKTGT
ncbi:uncharacterized protein LOC120352929 [Nilaparvata lugens]|uniref:uncharacterized protein LOC120352929 n=1 Tax=Nilaparvata lugens TaxID=108931 RepID=UPI00193D4F61|nr:uncharacterized protein LOC120352929 [Nilaparvata lugens]